MCGRVKLAGDWSEVGADLPWVVFDEMKTLLSGMRTYNVAPTDDLIVVTSADRPRKMRWGLLPFWAKSTKGKPLINARVETVEKKPAFRHAFKKYRCLIPVTGFYEWTSEMGRKQPYLFSQKDQHLYFAGLYSKWKDPEDQTLHSCTIITTEARGEIERYHHRMPLALEASDFEDWVDPNTPTERLHEILENPIPPAEVMKVSDRVNYVKYDDPACARPFDFKAPDPEGCPTQDQKS